jgi:hypothetical protein
MVNGFVQVFAGNPSEILDAPKNWFVSFNAFLSNIRFLDTVFIDTYRVEL